MNPMPVAAASRQTAKPLYTPPPLVGARDRFDANNHIFAPLHFEDEARFFTQAWMQLVNKNMISTVPLEEVHSEFLKASALGLSFDPNKGEAYLLSRYCEDDTMYHPLFYLGYKGMHKLESRDMNISSTVVEMVFAHEEFRDNGPGAIPTHVRDRARNKTQSGVVCGYAYSRLTNTGDIICTLVDQTTLMEIESMASMSGHGAWTGAFVNEMRRKTVARKHFVNLIPNMKLEQLLSANNVVNSQPSSFGGGLII